MEGASTSVRAVILAAWCACVTAVGGCARHAESPSSASVRPAVTTAVSPPAPAVKAASVQIAMRNVRLHVADGLFLHIRRLDGVMASRTAGQPPVFDDQRSYTLRVHAAEMSIDMSSLARLMNRYVFGYPGAPLTGLSATVDRDGRLRLKGKLHKGLTVPFSTRMTATVTDDGRMRLHLESMKAAGVPAKGVLHVLGLELDDLVDLKNRHDVTIEGDDIVIAPGEALPPPAIHGHLSRVAVRDQQLALTFSSPGANRASGGSRPGAGARNFIYFAGGTIRFGKLTMTEADLRLIDADPRDPFDFYPAEYQRQLVAGYSRNTPGGGLRTFMPDYDDLVRRPHAELLPANAQAPTPPGR
jgi:hypothetical protein